MDFNGLNQCFFPLNHHPQKYRLNLAQWRNTGGLKQKHKKQPFATALLRGRWHRQKDKNRSPSAKNQSSEIRLSENANKKRPECVMRAGIR